MTFKKTTGAHSFNSLLVTFCKKKILFELARGYFICYKPKISIDFALDSMRQKIDVWNQVGFLPFRATLEVEFNSSRI